MKAAEKDVYVLFVSQYFWTWSLIVFLWISVLLGVIALITLLQWTPAFGISSCVCTPHYYRLEFKSRQRTILLWLSIWKGGISQRLFKGVLCEMRLKQVWNIFEACLKHVWNFFKMLFLSVSIAFLFEIHLDTFEILLKCISNATFNWLCVKLPEAPFSCGGRDLKSVIACY